MSNTLEKLQDLAHKELAQAKQELMDKGWAYLDSIEILRHLDAGFIKSISSRVETVQEEVHFQSIRFGWMAIIAGYLKHISPGQAQLTYKSTDDHKDWGRHILGWTGDLEMVGRYLTASKADLVRITEPSEDIFQLEFTQEIIEKEHYDRQSYFFAKQLIAKKNQNAYQRHIIKYKTVKKQMLNGLRVINDAFISYSCTPDVDRYFSQLGYYHLAKERTFEDFGPEDTFGGLTYKTYLNVLQEISAVAIKHLHYCQAAVEKYPKLDLHNITVYTWHEDSTLADFADFTGLPPKDIQQIFACLTLDKDNIPDYEHIKGSDLPPYVKLADHQLTRTTYGVLGGGVDFLKRELKRRYRSDYDLAVNRREARFRLDLYEYFKEPRFLKTYEEIIIKLPGLHTDIDGAIYDTKTGTLGLFQLKWQDMFYTSLQERRSRISNAYASAEGWVKKMQQWLQQTTGIDVMKKLKFDSPQAGYKNVYLFVIARNQMHYTGLEPEPVAAWASWYQLIESYERYPVKTNDPVKNLYQQLKMGLPSNRVKCEGYPTGPSYNIKFKSFQFNFSNQKDDC